MFGYAAFRVCFASRALAAILLTTAPAFLWADDFYWNASGGDYNLADNWFSASGPGVPGATDNANFGQFGFTTAAVSLTVPATISRFQSDGAEVAFAMADSDFAPTYTYVTAYSQTSSLTLTHTGLDPVNWTTTALSLASSSDGSNRASFSVGDGVTVNAHTASSFFGAVSILSGGKVTTDRLVMSAGSLNVASGGELSFPTRTDQDFGGADLLSSYGDVTATIHGTLKTAGLYMGGIANKSLLTVDGPSATFVDDENIGTRHTTALIGQTGRATLEVLNGATATIKGDVILGGAGGYTDVDNVFHPVEGDGRIKVDDASLTIERTLEVGRDGGLGGLVVVAGNLTSGELYVGDHRHTTSQVSFDNSSTTIDGIAFGGIHYLTGTDQADYGAIGLSNGATLTTPFISFDSKHSDDYSIFAIDSTLNTTGRIDLSGGAMVFHGSTINMANVGAAVLVGEGRGVVSSEPSLFGLKSTQANIRAVIVGSIQANMSGAALLTASDTTLSTDSLSVGNAFGATGSARAEFTRSSIVGDATSAITVGRQGNGLLSGDYLTSNTRRLFIGDLVDGNGTVDLVNSLITANGFGLASTSFAAVIGGDSGVGVLDLEASTLNARNVLVGLRGTIRGNGSINSDAITTGGVHANVENHGTISPGHSPGTLAINGNLLETSTALLIMEIDLSDPAKFDQLLVLNDFTAGGTLELRALGSGTWNPNLSYTLISSGRFLGAFSNFVIDPRFTGLTPGSFTLLGGRFGINPSPVPEPASFVALAAGVAALIRRRSRRALASE